MKNKLIQLFALGVIIMLGACKKDPPLDSSNPLCPPDNQIDNCPQMFDARSEPLTGDFFKGMTNPIMCVTLPIFKLTDKYTYKDPIRNPKNPFEIAFLRFENGVQQGGASDLMVYNFCTNSLKIIAGHVAYTPDWSVKDWIIYTGTNHQLYKVKSNGDSLTQLTYTGNFNNHARWNNDGTKYLYYDATLGPGKMRICHANGNPIIVLERYMQKWAWLNDEEIIHDKYITTINQWAYSGIYKYNINSGNETHLSTIKATGVSMFYINQNKIYFDGTDGLYFLENGNLTLIDSAYQSFGAGSIQPLANNLLLLNRVISDTTGFDSCIVYQRRFLSLFDINTKKERVIKIPE